LNLIDTVKLFSEGNMNLNIPASYGSRHNSNWFKRVARWINHQHRMFTLYRFYLATGCRSSEAWDKAGRTL